MLAENNTFIMRIELQEVYCIQHVQPAACGARAAQDGYECGPTQNRKFTENMMRFFCFHSVFNVWPKTTLLPVWSRDAKSLDTPGLRDLM